jgi:Carbohydrate family 9 binding domain-like
MRKRFSYLVLMLLTMAMLPVQGGNPGIPIFSDDFNTVGLFAENWKAAKGLRPEEGKLYISHGKWIRLRREVKGDFAIAVDIAVVKPKEKKFGFCGVDIDGIKFLIRQGDGKAWVVYRLPGEKRSRGFIHKIDRFEFGKFNKVFISRQQLSTAVKYVYKVNDQQIASFVVSNMPQKNIISISPYRADCIIDNFQLFALQDKVTSPNLVVNSSFEYLQEGTPTYYDNYTRRNFNFKGPLEVFHKTWEVDSKVKHSGKYALKMEFTHLTRKNGFLTFDTGISTGSPFVYSVYLKASKPDFPVILEIWEMRTKWHRKKVKLSTEWKRYEFPLLKPSRSVVRCGLRFEQPGIVWADDVQIEFGEKVTKYQASSLDADKFSRKKEVITRPANIKLNKFAKAPVIDGDIEELWFKNGTKIDKFLFKEKKSKDKTVAWLGCDDQNLYVAVRSFVKDVSKIKAKKYPRDTGRLFGEDCIEIFLDPGMTRKVYYQLGINAAGSKADVGPGRNIGWNAKWPSAVKINKKTKSIDYEVKIPLSIIAQGNMTNKWGFNLGRNSTASVEASSLIKFPQVNFHKPEYYPALVWSEAVVGNFALEAEDFILMQDSVGGNIINNTGKSFKAEIQLFDADGNKLLGKVSKHLKKGTNAIQMPFAATVKDKAVKATVKILRNGMVQYLSPLRITVSRPIDLYTRYNYYMNEPDAVIVGTLQLPQADKLKGILTVGKVRKTVKLSKNFTIKVPLQSLSNGKHTVKLEIFNGSKKILQGQTTLVKKPFVKGATQVDHQRRCLVVDGKPFLVIAPLASVHSSLNKKPQMVRDMVALYKSYGFKCLMIVANPKAGPAIKEFMKAANAAGIKVICWVSTWRYRDKVTPAEVTEKFANPAIIAWLAIDEPELYAKSQEVKEFLTNFRKYTPYQPTFMNNTVMGIPARFADMNTDIIMLDDYLTNRENREVAELVEQADIMWKVGAEGRKPCFYFLVGNNMHNHRREPTFGEQMAQTYGSIVANCSGITYFLGLPYYPGNWKAVKQLNKELMSLQDIIFSLEKTSPAMISDSAVRFLTRKVGNKLYIIAVNLVKREANVIITLPAEFKYNATASVKFENRTLSVKNGKIADNFKGLERHVYCIELK